jgi:hypothetical protein
MRPGVVVLVQEGPARDQSDSGRLEVRRIHGIDVGTLSTFARHLVRNVHGERHAALKRHSHDKSSGLHLRKLGETLLDGSMNVVIALWLAVFEQVGRYNDHVIDVETDVLVTCLSKADGEQPGTHEQRQGEGHLTRQQAIERE